MFIFQLSAPVPVRMVGPAHILILAPVLLGGQEDSVKQVHESILYICVYKLSVGLSHSLNSK